MFESQFAALAEQTATPEDYVRLFSCFLLAYPLALPLPHLSSPRARHIYNVAVSTFFFVGLLRLYFGFAQLVATSALTYWMVANRVGGKKMPWIVFVTQMGHLLCNHLYRQLGGIPLTTIEITSMQMVLCMNLTTFAWDCFDGQVRSEEECDSSQKQTRITSMPGLLPFFGYCFYFPGVCVGPSSKFADYQAWSSNSLFISSKGKERASRAPRLPARRVRTALFELLLGAVFMGLWATIAPSYTYERLVAPGKEGIQHWSFLRRVLFVQITGFMTRTKYYGIWTLTNGACVLSGLGYNGVDARTGKTLWNRCQNVDFLNIEFANNWKELLDHWNMNTNVWLRNNVYKRIARPGKKPGFKSTMATFLTSAIWHGIAPGYYLTFLLGGFVQSLARSLRRHIRPFFFSDPRTPNPSLWTLSSYTPSQLFYSIISIASVQLVINYAAIPFILLDLSTSLEGWKVMLFYGHALTGAGLLLFMAGAGTVLDRLNGNAAAKARARKEAKERMEREKVNGDGGGKKGELQVPDVDHAVDAAKKKMDEVKKDL